jgi:hypothetical protein
LSEDLTMTPNAPVSAPTLAESRLGARRFGHLHGEAFCLMEYVCQGKPTTSADGTSTRLQDGCGHRETIWNARDGVTPFAMACPKCNGDLQHIDWRGDRYAPTYQPYLGQGIWRDGTPDEAEAIMHRRIEASRGKPYELNAEEAECLVQAARTGDEDAGAWEFRKGWPMFDRYDPAKHGSWERSRRAKEIAQHNARADRVPTGRWAEWDAQAKAYRTEKPTGTAAQRRLRQRERARRGGQ